MIVETNSGNFYRVEGNASPVAWMGVAVRRIGREWFEKRGARPQLVRKECSRIVQGEDE